MNEQTSNFSVLNIPDSIVEQAMIETDLISNLENVIDDGQLYDIFIAAVFRILDATTHRYAFGTKTNQWHVIFPDDRDWPIAITPAEFAELGPETARSLYLAPALV